MAKKGNRFFSFAFAIIISFSLISLAFWICPAVEKKYIYPIRYFDEVFEYSNEYNLTPRLVLSVIRAESGFNRFALSNKGAKGLMQITDATANYIAKNLGVNEFDIYSPKVNISFGCYYLRYLLDKFSVEETALCAYNAGEGIVRKWLKDKEYSADGITLKVIPYSETEKYIKKIYKSYGKYEKLYGDFLDKSKKFE